MNHAVNSYCAMPIIWNYFGPFTLKFLTASLDSLFQKITREKAKIQKYGTTTWRRVHFYKKKENYAEKNYIGNFAVLLDTRKLKSNRK